MGASDGAVGWIVFEDLGAGSHRLIACGFTTEGEALEFIAVFEKYLIWTDARMQPSERPN